MQTVDLKTLGLEDGMRLLDLGCGAGRHLHAAYYFARIDAIGVDIKREDVERTRAGFASIPDMEPDSHRWFGLAAADARRLPFPNASLDRVICSEVLEHVPDFVAVLDECARTLKPGGKLAISVPRFGPEWLCWKLEPRYHQAEGGHIRIFKPRALIAAAERAGFRLYRKHHAHGLHSAYWWLQCWFWDRRETSSLVRAYRNLLEWDILKAPLITRVADRVTSPLMGKSAVFYFERART
jgi:SAM-dependent methyltransferase